MDWKLFWSLVGVIVTAWLIIEVIHRFALQADIADAKKKDDDRPRIGFGS